MNKVAKAAVSAIVLVLVAGLGYYAGTMRDLAREKRIPC